MVKKTKDNEGKKKPQNEWIKHLLAVKAKNKGMSLGEAMKEARKTYKPKKSYHN